MSSNRIALNETDIKAFLDERIQYWRRVRDNYKNIEHFRAQCYIDAFQSVRTSLFDEFLPASIIPPLMGGIIDALL